MAPVQHLKNCHDSTKHFLMHSAAVAFDLAKPCAGWHDQFALFDASKLLSIVVQFVLYFGILRNLPMKGLQDRSHQPHLSWISFVFPEAIVASFAVARPVAVHLGLLLNPLPDFFHIAFLLWTPKYQPLHLFCSVLQRELQLLMVLALEVGRFHLWSAVVVVEAVVEEEVVQYVVEVVAVMEAEVVFEMMVVVEEVVVEHASVPVPFFDC
mmetsp:Transcript_13926/g.23685  ORF Transcript_13926/g.23685 Transcript_13926/m.23685 type:complete len:210 (-) Transcript_13926:676-1305(-)